MTYLALEPAPVVRRDVFPADVTLPDGTALSRVLLVVTTGGVYVWDGPDREPLYAGLLTAPATLPSSFGLSGAEGSAPTGDGVVRWRAGTGCRCGLLARFRPFTGPRRAQ